MAQRKFSRTPSGSVSPGEHLVIDWGLQGELHVFCTALAWSRIRFVRFADNERADTTMAMLADCFETLGGVPRVVLADCFETLGGVPRVVLADCFEALGGVPQRRGRDQRRRADRGLRPLRRALRFRPDFAKPGTRSGKGSWRTSSVTPKPT